MDNSAEMLERQIETEIQGLSTMEPDSEEKAKAVDNLTKLHKLKIDEAKIELERKNKEDENKHRYIKLIVEVGLVGAGLAFNHHWRKAGFIFEEEGSIRSSTLRDIIKFDPLKIRI